MILTKQQIVLATTNQGKAAEFAALLKELPVEVRTLKDYPQIPDIIEDGNTFIDNALIKARTVAKACGQVAMADDSGLMVDVLNGAPGIFSARFAGEEKDDAKNTAKLLNLLKDTAEAQRGAQFCCAIAIVLPDGREYTTEGICRGQITFAPAGSGGFGYDPVFYVPKLQKTFAELSMGEKNAVSHRGIANAQALEILQKLFKEGV
mgnify:CR=1 FL=1